MKLKRVCAVALVMTLGAATLFTGCGSKIDDKAIAVSIDGGAETINLGYVNFVARYMQATYDPFYTMYYGDTVWSTDMTGSGVTMQDDVKSYIMDIVEENYLSAKHAEELGISVSEEEQASIEAAADQFLAANEKETLEAMGASKEYIVKFLTESTLNAKVQKAVKDAANIEVTKDEAWQRTFTYAFFSTTTATDADGNSIDVTDEYIASQKQAAETLAAAEDFDSAAEASGATVTTYSYTKGETEDSRFDMSVIEAAEKLSEGQASSVIEVADNGYYVIRLDSEYDESATESQIESLTSQKRSDAYSEQLEEWKSAIDWSVDETKWATVEFNSIFDTKATEEDTAEDAD